MFSKYVNIPTAGGRSTRHRCLHTNAWRLVMLSLSARAKVSQTSNAFYQVVLLLVPSIMAAATINTKSRRSRLQSLQEADVRVWPVLHGHNRRSLFRRRTGRARPQVPPVGVARYSFGVRRPAALPKSVEVRGRVSLLRQWGCRSMLSSSAPKKCRP